MSHLFISAAHKSSGKTTITLGLCAALTQRGQRVQPFKKGPDYIDPLWLTQAAGRSCGNLDFYTMTTAEISAVFARRMRGADIGIIEGNKGLYDGLDLDGSNSNAALAKLLQAPVVLVIDARGMTRGIAPLILGYQHFDPAVRIAGVILNQLGGSRHESKLRAVIEHYTDVTVLGAVHRDPQLEIVERHLGLMPSNETPEAAQRIGRIAAAVASQVDLDALQAIAASAPTPAVPAALAPSHEPAAEGRTALPSPAHGRRWPEGPDEGEGTRIRLGIARDAAFGFYYPDDLDALRAGGAELVPIDTLRDTRLPTIDGLFIGGGFPETQMQLLSANATLRGEIRAAIEAGLPVYAECGGLMYLARSLRWGERQYPMVGVIPGDVVMHERPQGRGYIRLRETGAGLWPAEPAAPTPLEFNAHEFHYSSLENLPADTRYAYQVLRGNGVDGQHDGIVYKNLLACYGHLRDAANHHWTARFLQFVRACKQSSTHSLSVTSL
ncbi:MAG: cobyrinate a,c-diamide synthase [Gammaproteobacteria bacterium]